VIVCTKFKVSQAIRSWNVTIFVLIRHDTLWPWPLTPWRWTFVVHRASCVQTLYIIRAKSNNPRQSYWRYRTFLPSSSRGWRTFSGRFSGLREPNFIKLGADAEQSYPRYEFDSEFRCLAAFSNASASKLSDVENDAKFRTFFTPCKIRGAVGELCGRILGASPTTERQHIWWRYSARLLNAMSPGKKETRKRGNCECIATWDSPTPRSSYPFNTSPVASLKSLSLSVAVLARIYCLYVTLRCDLELWPRNLDLWPWNL